MKALQKISDVLDRACSWAIGILFGVMTVTYFLQVLLRYAFGTGFMWTEELTRYADIWAIMVGASMIAKRKNWINVSVLEEMLNGRPRAKAVLIVFQQILTLAFFIAMFAIAFRFIELAGTQVSTNMRIPKRWVYWIFPPAFAVAIYQTLVAILSGLGTLKHEREAKA